MWWRQFLNFNAIFLILTGLFLILWGGWRVYRFRDLVFGGSLSMIGVGILAFGLTNGFADQTPRGRMLFKFGVFSFIIGILAFGYSMRHLI